MQRFIQKKKNSYANRGMNLEHEINLSNQYYKDNNLALIYKKPTPIKETKLKYSKYSSPKITEAFYCQTATTDYNGVYKGIYLDFEAKETQSKTSFALKNIPEHQINHLNEVNNHGGMSFIIVRFNILKKTFLLETKYLIKIKNSTKKSIPLNFFLEKGHLIKDKYQPLVDYLEIIDKIKGENNEKTNK